MLLYPDQRAALQSDAAPEAVRARLANLVAPGAVHPGGAFAESFAGELRGEEFSVVRAQRGLVGWATHGPRPVLSGRIRAAGAGTRVEVTARAERVFRLAELPTLLFVPALLLTAGAQGVRAGSYRGLAFMALLIGLGLAVGRFAFRREARQAVASLAEALGCAVAPRQANRLVRS